MLKTGSMHIQKPSMSSRHRTSSPNNKKSTYEMIELNKHHIKEIKSQFFKSGETPNSNSDLVHPLTKLRQVLNSAAKEESKETLTIGRKDETFQNLAMGHYLKAENHEENKRNSLERIEDLGSLLKSSLKIKKSFQLRNSLANKSSEEQKARNLNLDLKLIKVEYQPSSKVFAPDEIILSQRFFEDNGTQEEITDLFMDEPFGYSGVEESKHKKSKMLVSSVPLSKEAQDGIKEFKEKNIKNHLLNVNEIFLYRKNSENYDALKEDFKEFSKKYISSDYINIFSFVIFKALLSFLSFLVNDGYNYIYVFFYLDIGLICSLLFYFLCYMKFKKLIFKIFIVIIYIIFWIGAIVNERYNPDLFIITGKVKLFLILLSLTYYSFLSYVEKIIYSVMYLSIEILLMSVSKYENDYKAIVYVLGFLLLNLGLINYKTKLLINLFNEQRTNMIEKQQLNKLIKYLLPPHVIKKKY